MVDQYKTIAHPIYIDFKEKSSKFIAYIFPIKEETDAKLHLAELWKIHAKATHICYALKCGFNGDYYKSNDDGEPSGTAGKPILGQITSFDLTNVFIAVVRYYGGVKLGTTGLIQAYKESAKAVILQSEIITKYVHECYEMIFDYEFMGTILNEVKNLECEIVNKDFGSNPRITIALRKSISNLTMKRLKAKLLNFELDRVEDETVVPFCKITKIMEIC